MRGGATVLDACPRCGLVHLVPAVPEGRRACCRRCGASIERRLRASLERTAALSIAALAMYLPANLLPILSLERFGVRRETTVWQGVVELYESGSWGVASIVFVASMLVPLIKLVGLAWLCLAANRRAGRLERARLHRMIEAIGPWAMIDVFLVAILVAAVKLGDVAVVLPGPGLAAYASLVVFSILASASFDPRLVWEETDDAGSIGRVVRNHPPTAS